MEPSANLAELLARVALRDAAAFERLYRATSAHLLGVAYRICHHRERAEELLQEAFISVWHAAGSYDAAIASPMTWLINIVRNRTIDAVRSGATERASTQPLDEQAHQVPDDAAREPQRLLDEALARSHIAACMQELSAVQRQALALAYYRGMVHTEIATALGAPLGTAKAWVRRGLDKLKACLEAAGVRESA
jgi:RNA polymerase sigma-70 factor (ECF subfamily)